jgi:hypothetical protein
MDTVHKLFNNLELNVRHDYCASLPRLQLTPLLKGGREFGIEKETLETNPCSRNRIVRQGVLQLRFELILDRLLLMSQ